MKIFGLAIAIGLTLVAPGVGAAQQAGISVANKADIQRAAERGRMIYAYDQAAWHGTDDMLAKIPHPETVVGGWIVDGPAESPELVFFDKNEADPHAVYVAQFRSNKLVSSRLLGSSDDTRLSPQRILLIKARKIGLDAFFASKVERCTQRPYNTVVLPSPLPGGPTWCMFSPRRPTTTRSRSVAITSSRFRLTAKRPRYGPSQSPAFPCRSTTRVRMQPWH